MLAAPFYLERHGRPRNSTELGQHVLLGFTQPATLNEWPLPDADDMPVRITPSVAASSGEAQRQLALEVVGIVCLAGYLTHRDRAEGRLIQLFPTRTPDVRQPIHAVNYRNAALIAHIASFVSYLSEHWDTGVGGRRAADVGLGI